MYKIVQLTLRIVERLPPFNINLLKHKLKPSIYINFTDFNF
jgi:hypothetical protein